MLSWEEMRIASTHSIILTVHLLTYLKVPSVYSIVHQWKGVSGYELYTDQFSTPVFSFPTQLLLLLLVVFRLFTHGPSRWMSFFLFFFSGSLLFKENIGILPLIPHFSVFPHNSPKQVLEFSTFCTNTSPACLKAFVHVGSSTRDILFYLLTSLYLW